jgi:hypothetical protein
LRLLVPSASFNICYTPAKTITGRENLTFAAKLKIGVRSQESGARRKEEEGRRKEPEEVFLQI